MAGGLRVISDEQVLDVADRRDIVLGRSKSADLRLADNRVSGQHACLRPVGPGWELVDLGSSNGTFVDGRRVTVHAVQGQLTMRLGGTDGVSVTVCEVAAEVQTAEHPSGATVASAAALTIGRAPENDIVVDDLLVSRQHAEIDVSSSPAHLRDLGSANGVFVNGQRMRSHALAEGDLIGLGAKTFRWLGGRLVLDAEEAAPSFRADGLTVQIRNGATLLDDVSVALSPRSLLAVIGPSGAGKTTLLGALTGLQPATRGTVRWNKRDLYENYDQLRHRIGLVPQQDILHPQLTVRRALGYAAQLRFLRDTTAAERERRVDQVLAEVGLADRADLRIDRLSGGQRKRTSVALELLTAPPLLFLDEPTSGLDPGLDRQVMSLMRDLADAGRTVVVVTHSVLNLDVCDRVLLVAAGGRTAYFGPPDQLLTFFGVQDYSSAFQKIDEDSAEWPRRFRESHYAARYLTGVAGQQSVAASSAISRPGGPAQTARGVSQLLTLCRRYLSVIAADRQYAALLVGMPLVLALLAHVVPGSDGLAQPRGAGGNEASQRLIVLMISGALVGLAVSVRELIKERVIYRRERAAGLSQTAYLFSKLLVLGVITGLQATVFAALATAGIPAPREALVLWSPRLEIIIAVIAVTIASMVIGLVLSSLVSESEQAMPLLVLVVMAQLILCGGLVPITGRPGLEQVSWLMPAHWSYSAAASTIGLQTRPDPTRPPDWSWEHTASVWLTDLGVLTLLCVLATGLVAGLLARSVRRRPLA